MTRMRAEVLRVAGESMTTAQFRVFVLHFFGGWSETEIAKAYDVSQQAVGYALWGQRKQPGAEHVGGGVKKIRAALAAHNGGGLMSKLGTALDKDDAFQQVLAELKTEPQAPSVRTTAGWFRGVPVNDFEARAVLLVMHHIAGPSGKLSLVDLVAEVPKMVANSALGRLKVSGHIRTNGAAIEILSLPPDPEANHDHEAP